MRGEEAAGELRDEERKEEEEADEEDGAGEDEEEKKEVGWEWRGRHRQKRILLAVLHEDSTVVYYIMHDGIVKPRQN